MRGNIVAAAFAVLFAASPVLAQSADDGTPPAPLPTGTASTMTPGTANSTAVQTFATTAEMSNLFEIQSSQLAEQQATADNLKSFAGKMVADHKAADQQMQVAGRTQNISVPNALDPAHHQQISQLQGMSGQQFDQAYIRMQVQAHDDAVGLFENYAQSGPAGALKDFATKMLPTLQMHQKMIHQIAGK